MLLPKLTLLTGPTSSSTYHLDLIPDKSVQGVPVIAFVDWANKRNATLIQDDDEQMSGSAMVREAFDNLRNLTFTWESLGSVDDGYQHISGDFAAEKILDKKFLIDTAASLNAEEIIVGIPCSGKIYCCVGSDERALKKISALVHQSYHDFSASPLSKDLYRIRNGIIVAHFPSTTEKDNVGILMDFPEAFDFTITRSTRLDDTFSIRVDAAAEENTIYFQGLLKALNNALHEFGGQQGFNGEIHIQGAIERPAKNRQNVEALNIFFDRLKSHPIFRKHLDLTGGQLQITFLFGEDFSKGDIDRKFILKF